jgi:hypothetical protein
MGQLEERYETKLFLHKEMLANHRLNCPSNMVKAASNATFRNLILLSNGKLRMLIKMKENEI